jgi:hypothetical protein
MALPSSGAISFANVNADLAKAAGTTLSLNDFDLRNWIFGKPTSGSQISLSDGYGKSYEFVYTFATSASNVNLRSLLDAAGYNGVGAARVIINSGVYIWSSSTSVPALSTGSFPSTLTIINNGFIMGCGGDGGTLGLPSQAGGIALNVGTNCTIQNNSFIAGGGGGGGGYWEGGGSGWTGGGGAGGGRIATRSGSTGNYSYASGGAIGQNGFNPPYNGTDRRSASGGRQLPGTAGPGLASASGYRGVGTVNGAGGGGGSQVETATPGNGFGGTGGGGGDAGTVGSRPTGENFNGAQGGAGGYGASGAGGSVGSSLGAAAGAAGGAAVVRNGFSVTYTATGTRYGSV